MAVRGAGPTATYGIQFESNAKEVGEEGATALEQLRKQIETSTDAIKGHSDSLRKLKGNTDEIKRARDELKAKIDAERTAISKNTLELLKAGTSYDKLTKEHKKFADEIKKGDAEKSKKQMDALSGVMGKLAPQSTKLTGDISELASAFGLTTGAVAGTAIAAVAAVAVIAVLAAGVVALTLSLASFVLEAGNAARTMQLTRVAFDGSVDDARRLGNQVDELAKKLPTAKEEINAMGDELTLAGLGGKTLVDTLNAAQQASAALGKGAGDKVADFVKRSKLTGRFSLGALETQGLGVQFGDVAAALAKNTKTSIADASQALIEGRVTLGDAAAALRTTFEKRFAGVNLAKMLDLDVLKVKIKESLGALTKDINLQPVLEAFAELAHMLDTSTETGADLKLLLEGFGEAFVGSVTTAKPIVKGFIEGLLMASLDLYDEWLTLKLQFIDTFGDTDVTKNIDLVQAGFIAADTAVKSMTVGLQVLGPILKTVLTDALAVIKALREAHESGGGIGGVVQNATGGGGITGAALKALLPGFATGLARVPSDDYAVRLHKDERVLTAAEARAYNELFGGKSGGEGEASGGGGLSIGQITIPVTVEGGSSSSAEDMAAMVRRELVKALETVLRTRALTPAMQGGGTT